MDNGNLGKKGIHPLALSALGRRVLQEFGLLVHSPLQNLLVTQQYYLVPEFTDCLQSACDQLIRSVIATHGIKGYAH